MPYIFVWVESYRMTLISHAPFKYLLSSHQIPQKQFFVPDKILEGVSGGSNSPTDISCNKMVHPSKNCFLTTKVECSEFQRLVQILGTTDSVQSMNVF